MSVTPFTEGKVSQEYIEDVNNIFTGIREWFLNPENEKFIYGEKTDQYVENEKVMWSLSVDIMIHGTDANKSFMLDCATDCCMEWGLLTHRFTIVDEDDKVNPE
jgi:hypothetical protein